MLDRYSHIRLESKRNALAALSDNHGKQGNATPQITVSGRILWLNHRYLMLNFLYVIKGGPSWPPLS